VLSRKAVIWGYRLMLGREPESELVIEMHRQLGDIPTFRRSLLECPEFAQHNAVTALPRRWVIAPVLGGERMMWLDLGDHFVSRGCLLDDYEPAETHFVKAVLRPGDVFVDVGANIGWFTLVASVAVGETGRVHAFEPRAETAAHLAKTVALNGLDGRVATYPYGLSDSETSAVLVWASGTDNPGGSAVWSGDIPANMEKQAIALRPLDGLGLGRADVVKVDVEGAELRVFRGARETLARCRPYILSELSPAMLQRACDAPADAYFAFFAELGYRCFIVDVERCGEETHGFPTDWHKPLINLALVPEERPVPPSLWYRAPRP
jgi:FkbM family methyltransferase